MLITKLRSAQGVDHQYRKATKALLVLIPLFGVTYIITFAGPTQGVYKSIHEILRATLLSTQVCDDRFYIMQSVTFNISRNNSRL